MKTALFILVVLLAVVAVFAVQNPGTIVVRFLTVSVGTSLVVVVALSLVAGVLAGGLARLPAFFRRRAEATAAARRIRELEAEVENLKGKTGGPTPSAPGGTP
ncbi:MAG TPA: lipopolysaccharide assembly protein LapA domain-containing protein [Candidatus Methylomirabilis sp.]|nr:lipopolysaccharide assembly protein LapA domain-containing protein [Candidatus Methylomirabilis sp.]